MTDIIVRDLSPSERARLIRSTLKHVNAAEQVGPANICHYELLDSTISEGSTE
jgi:hypothetical protein